jgi:hypothetical protein
MVKQLCVVAVLASMTGGCGGGSGAPSVDGSWIFENPDGVTALGLDIGPGDTYVGLTIAITSSTLNSATANAQVVTGTFATEGSLITFTPRQWSCPGPDPVKVDTYSFAGQDLVLGGTGGFVLFAPNNASGAGSAGLTFGCFSAAGVFTPEALAPVAN